MYNSEWMLGPQKFFDVACAQGCFFLSCKDFKSSRSWYDWFTSLFIAVLLIFEGGGGGGGAVALSCMRYCSRCLTNQFENLRVWFAQHSQQWVV